MTLVILEGIVGPDDFETHMGPRPRITGAPRPSRALRPAELLGRVEFLDQVEHSR